MSEVVKRFLDVALRELSGVSERLDHGAIVAAAALIRKSEADGGRVHVTGIGKPEHLARYAASLLSSTGTPAAFLHGTEVTHGSVGQVRPGDIVVAISNTGTTAELLRGVEALRDFGTRLIAVTGDVASPLARMADVVLEARVDDEGGPLNLAPRASFLAEAIVLAALSVELQAARDFTPRTITGVTRPAPSAGGVGDRPSSRAPDRSG